MSFSLDFETRSPVDLLNCGGYVYFEHPQTDVMIASWSVKGGPRGRWRLGEPCPPVLVDEIKAGEKIHAWNANFERLAIWKVLGPRYGWPVPPIEQFVCTMVTAQALGLPGKLERAGPALGLPVRKDNEGHALMKRMSKPRKPRKGEDPDGLYWYGWDDPALVERLHAYCDQDVVVEEQAAARIPPLKPSELDLYHFDQLVNDRGIRLDRASLAGANRIIETYEADANRRMSAFTGGFVETCTNPAKLVAWVEEQKVSLPTAQKADIAALLDTEDLPPHVRDVLELRHDGAKASVKKVLKMRARACRDGRARGAFAFHKASTGRWASLGIQFQNMPRTRKEFSKSKPNIPALFRAMRTGDVDAFVAPVAPSLGQPLHLIADMVRGFLWAEPGHQLLVADFSAIEGRLTAWFAGEEDEVQRYRDNDAGHGEEVYKLTAADIFDIPATEVDDEQRQVGKVGVLSLGFGGGVMAYYKMGRNYGLELDKAYPAVWRSADEERRERAVKRLEECIKRNDTAALMLSREAWLAAELIKIAWRKAHPRTTEMWKALVDAAKEATEQPGLQVTVLGGKIAYLVRRGFLWCRLPSGRCLAYGMPKVEQVEAPWADPEQPPKKRERIAAVTALGTDKGGHLTRKALSPNILVENVVQGAARDLLANGMLRAEAAGYPVIGHVHDEIITERRRGEGDVAEFERLICELPDWAAGLPLRAAGWRGKRYRK